MFRVREPIVDVVARRIRDWKVDRVIEGLVRRAAGYGERKRKALRLGDSIGTGQIRLVKHGWIRRLPIQAEGRVADLVEQVQVLNRRVVHAVGRADTGLAGPPEDLARHSLAEAGRIGDSQAWAEVVVPGRGERAGNSRISRNHPAQRSRGEL